MRFLVRDTYLEVLGDSARTRNVGCEAMRKLRMLPQGSRSVSGFEREEGVGTGLAMHMVHL